MLANVRGTLDRGIFLLLLCFSVFFGLAGCRAVDPVFLDERGKHIRGLEPAYYKIAVAPVRDWKEGDHAAGGDLDFVYDTAALLQAKVVEKLQELNAASAIEAVKREDEESLVEAGFDLLVVPKVIGKPSMEYLGSSRRSWVGVLLWAVSHIPCPAGWAGRLVEDKTFKAEFGMEFEIKNVIGGKTRIGRIVAGKCSKVDITFKERSSSFGKRILSWIVPPTVIGHEPKRTSKSLSDRMVLAVTAALAKNIKTGLPAIVADRYGSLEVTSPKKNGAKVKLPLVIEGTITSKRFIDDVGFVVNQERAIIRNEIEQTGRVAVEIDGQTMYRQEFQFKISRLDGGKEDRNLIQILAQFGGSHLSWSIAVLHRGR